MAQLARSVQARAIVTRSFRGCVLASCADDSFDIIILHGCQNVWFGTYGSDVYRPATLIQS